MIKLTMLQIYKTFCVYLYMMRFILPLLAGTLFLCNPAQAALRPADPVVQVIEQAPTFQGGNAAEFSKWVAEHLVYPKDAKEDGIQGRVMVQYTIGDDGKVSNVKVLRGICESLDAEAVRVVSSSPVWEPGIQDGKPVKVTYQIPIMFRLPADE